MAKVEIPSAITRAHSYCPASRCGSKSRLGLPCNLCRIEPHTQGASNMSPAPTHKQRTSWCAGLLLLTRAFCGALPLLLAIPDTLNAAQSQSNTDLASRPPKFFKICHDQTYALCAAASCFVLNQVAYCKCDVEHGDSISLPFKFDKGENVCTVNAEGADNGFMVSTFSLPPSVVAPSGDMALYTCPGATSDGAYAQCDGGLCFTSTEGGSFMRVARPLKKGEIVCSCPITVAAPSQATLSTQIAGPDP